MIAGASLFLLGAMCGYALPYAQMWWSWQRSKRRVQRPK